MSPRGARSHRRGGGGGGGTRGAPEDLDGCREVPLRFYRAERHKSLVSRSPPYFQLYSVSYSSRAEMLILAPASLRTLFYVPTPVFVLLGSTSIRFLYVFYVVLLQQYEHLACRV